VRGQQTPSARGAPLDDRCQHYITSRLVHCVGRLIHEPARCKCSAEIRLQHRAPGETVLSIHGRQLVAMDARAIAGEGDQVGHERGPSRLNRSLWSRLVYVIYRTPMSRDQREWLERNRFAVLERAFQIALDSVARHFASFFDRIAERADLRNRGHKNAEPALGHRLKDRRVTVFCQDTFSIGPAR
jgi:hypothetical protein